MTRIRVNPENLIQKSADLSVAAVGLRGLSDDVKQTAESAPSYDGQFGPLVSALGFSALISGKKRAESIADHSSDLVQRASAFLDADASGTLSQNSFIHKWVIDATVYFNYLFLLALFTSFPLLQILNLGMLWKRNRILPSSSSIGNVLIINFAVVAFRYLLGLFRSSPSINPSEPVDPINDSLITISTVINFRQDPNMAGAIIAVLPVGAIVTVIGPSVNRDGHTWVQVKDSSGIIGWIAKDVLDEDKTIEITNSPISSGNTFISQLNPDGDEQILGLIINSNNKTVLQDINAEGCQMTCYTMLLRDKGYDVTVTDLYKANWISTHQGQTWEDAIKEGIQGENTYVSVDMKNVSNNQYTQVSATISGTNDEARWKSLDSLLDNSPVIVNVEKDGIPSHFIVVDCARDDIGPGYYDVRDPLSNRVETIKIGSDGYYDFLGESGHRVLNQVTSN